MEVIYKRRSIRKFTTEPVPREKIQEFIKAGMNAPSAGNAQPWHYIIIDDRDTLNRIADCHTYGKMLFKAPAAIIVCAEPALERHPGFWVQDCAAATENILLEIVDQGYGAVWLGVHPNRQLETFLQNILGIPKTIIPFCGIALGRPAEEKARKDIFLPDRIKFNHWLSDLK